MSRSIAIATCAALAVSCRSTGPPDRVLDSQAQSSETQSSETQSSETQSGETQSSESQSADEPELDEEPSRWAEFFDDQDRMFDVSKLIAKGVGFIPILSIVTEPAIGYGLAAGALYIHPTERKFDDRGNFIPPSISFGGALYTESDTWGGALGHMGVWNDGRTRYLGAVFTADANLSFYGLADEIEQGIDWNPRTSGTVQAVKHAVADRLFLGARYSFIDIENTFSVAGIPGVDPVTVASRNAGLGPTLTWDDRDNTFTPSSGNYGDARFIYYSETFGGDFDYGLLELRGYRYWDLDEVVVGARLQAAFAGNDSPFYALPFLEMRGVPAYRYVGEATLVAEIEPRWRITPRWGAVAFLSAGRAVLDAGDFGSGKTVVAGGGGVRYLLARSLGLHAGADIGVGPEEVALYFVIGSSWGGR